MAGKQWTDADTETLRRIYPHATAKDTAQALGCSEKRVYAKANSLGLKKSAEFLASQQSGRIQRGKQDPRMVRSQFQKGRAPWNKGVPGSTGLHPNCRATQFVKGRKPEDARNYLPIGSVRLSKDGYAERKVTDDQTLAPARRWVSVHRLVWEAAFGPTPPGHIIVFRPGRKTAVEAEITVEVVECISRAENARRNHPRTRSPELGRLSQLKGAITRQVNRIIKEANDNASHHDSTSAVAGHAARPTKPRPPNGR